MASLSNAVTIIVVFAILIQFLVDRVKELVGDKVMNIVKAPVWAVAFGALFALMFDIDFFALIDKICEALDCTITDLLEYIPNERKTTGKYLILEEHGNRKQKKEKD